ncbi:MAG: serine/threonine-protein phosphatase [Candidatus Hydrogenedentota bacterium]|nr:MAG: serine/threonine-protein phosphatase [Candidatus Hydrogenedentota bacterium]
MKSFRKKIQESLSLKFLVLYALFASFLLSVFWVALSNSQSMLASEIVFADAKLKGLQTAQLFRTGSDRLKKLKAALQKKKKKQEQAVKKVAMHVKNDFSDDFPFHALIKSSGKVLYSSDASLQKVTPFHYKNLLRALQSYELSGSSVFIAPAQKKAGFYFYFPISYGKNKTAFWISFYPTSGLKENLKQNLTALFIVIGGVFVLLIFFGFLIHRKLLRRLKTLAFKLEQFWPTKEENQSSNKETTSSDKERGNNNVEDKTEEDGKKEDERMEEGNHKEHLTDRDLNKETGDEIDYLFFETAWAKVMIQEKQAALTEGRNKLQHFNELVQNELDMAAEIQQGMIPTSGMLGQMEAGVYYAPLEKVSGDYFGFFPHPEGDYYIMADVSGHGIPAALITMMIRVQMNVFVPQGLEPGSMLAQMNKAVAPKIVTSDYFTAFLVRLLPNHTLQYANASHQKAIVLRKQTGEIEELDAMGFFIGAVDELPMEHETNEISFEVGDRLILYSDGIVEGTNILGEEFGNERFHEEIMATRSLSVQDAVDTIIRNVDAFAEGEPRKDDYTLIILELRRRES